VTVVMKDKKCRLVILLFAAWVFSVYNAYGCTCTDHLSPRKALKKADVVFLGKVIAAAESGAGDVLFEVLASWKRVDFDPVPVKVFSAPLEGCTFRFSEDGIYLVYAKYGDDYFYEMPGQLVTDACTRTVELDLAGEDLQELRRPLWFKERVGHLLVLGGKHR
jgi:hypothetical protein